MFAVAARLGLNEIPGGCVTQVLLLLVDIVWAGSGRVARARDGPGRLVTAKPLGGFAGIWCESRANSVISFRGD